MTATRQLFFKTMTASLLPLTICLSLSASSSASSDPYQLLEAENYDSQTGTLPGEAITAVGYIENGDYVVYESLNFDRGPKSGTVYASSDTTGGIIEFRKNAVDGILLGTADITATAGWSSFEDFPISINNDYSDGTAFLGTIDLYLVFKGNSGYLFDVDNFKFEPADVSVEMLEFVNCPKNGIATRENFTFLTLITPLDATNQTVAFSSNDGTSIDYLSGEFSTAVPGEYTVTATSLDNGVATDSCMFEVFEREPLSPYQSLRAESFDLNSGTLPGETTTAVGYIESGDYIAFYDVAFTDFFTAGEITGSSDLEGGQVEFRIDSPNGPIIATSSITNTGGWSNFAAFDIVPFDEEDVNDISNRLIDLYLVFQGDDSFLFDVDTMIFFPEETNEEIPEEELAVEFIQFVDCPLAPISVGESIDLDVSVFPVNATNTGVTFSSSTPGAQIDPLTGIFTATFAEFVSIIASSDSDPSITAECTLFVR